MTPGSDRDHVGQAPEGDDYVRQQLASIDGTLFNGMPSDDRYESGVPEGQRGNSLDFIQMTGLTRPPLRGVSHRVDGALAQTPLYDDLNPSQPLSFYEKGVADVDDSLAHTMLPGGLHNAMLDSDLVPNRSAETLVAQSTPFRSAQAFRDIVVGLGREDIVEEAEEAPGDIEVDGATDATTSDDGELGEVSTSGALLALVEEIEASMGKAAEPDDLDSPGAQMPVDEQDDHPEAGIEAAAPISAPAAEIDDDDFDALLASLSDRGEALPAKPTEPEADFEPESESAIFKPEPEAEAVSDISEEWDTLLDTMSIRGAEPIPEPAPEPTPESTPTPAPVAVSRGALAEAEQLMQALEKRPKSTPHTSDPTSASAVVIEAPEREESLAPDVLVPMAVAPSGSELSDGRDGDPAQGYDYNATPSRRRSRRHSRVARRGLKLVKAVFFLALLGGLGTVLWIYVVAPMLLQDEDLSARAERLMTAQDYSAASQTYLQLASRMAPGDTERSNAEFRAAYALTLGPETSGDDTKRRYVTALALFKQFTEDYPQHPKRARALSMMGRLHFELQDFEQAITVLRDQVKPADDPAAALSMLRYLARAYSMTGNYEQAETSYLQAATLPGNYNAEADYLELGDLFRQRAGLENDLIARKPLEDTAMAYWRRAMQVPGLAPGDRNTLEERLQWLTFTEEHAESPASDGRPDAPPEIPTVSPEVAPAVENPAPVSEIPAPPASPIPVAADETGRAEVPGAELEALAPPQPEAVQ